MYINQNVTHKRTKKKDLIVTYSGLWDFDQFLIVEKRPAFILKNHGFQLQKDWIIPKGDSPFNLGFRLGDKVEILSNARNSYTGVVVRIETDRVRVRLDGPIDRFWSCPIRDGIVFSDFKTDARLVNLTPFREGDTVRFRYDSTITATVTGYKEGSKKFLSLHHGIQNCDDWELI